MTTKMALLFRTVMTKPILRSPYASSARYCVVHSLLSSKQDQRNEKSDMIMDFAVNAAFQKYDSKPTLANAVVALDRLTQLVLDKELALDELVKKPMFNTLCQDVGKRPHHLSQSILVKILKNLLDIKLPSECYIMQSLSTEVIWKARTMSIGNLTSVLRFLRDQDADIHQQMLKKIQAILEQRWVDIVNVADVCTLLSVNDIFPPDFHHKLDDRTLSLIENAKADELVKLLITLSDAKRRSTPVLRSLAHHLLKKEDELAVKQLASMLHAMKVLNFPHDLLLQNIADRLIPKIPSIEKSNIVGSILTCVGQLKWKNIALLRACTEWITQNFDKCRVQDLVCYILTCGSLNYLPENSDDLLARLSSTVTKDSVDVPAIWLDVVWSLAVLTKATQQQIASVLAPDFTTGISSVVQKMKLFNLNSLAKTEIPKYRGLLLPPNFKDVVIPRSQDAQKLVTDVATALNTFLPRGKYLTLNKSVHGISVDAEFIMDMNSRPLPISSHSISLGINTKLVRPLPHGAHRIALMVWNYKDLIVKVEGMNNAEPTGAAALSKRILENLGYVVVEIPHSEFPAAGTSVFRKVQYLQRKVDAAIQNKKEAQQSSILEH